MKLVEPGMKLWDEKGRVWAEVRADGTLALTPRSFAHPQARLPRPGQAAADSLKRARALADDASTQQGSIHRMGAVAQGTAACNGWTFWHVERGGRLEPIDHLRALARSRLGLADAAE